MITITPQMAEEMYRNSQAPAKESKYKFENGRMIERNPEQTPKQRGRGGILSSMISELGGATGAATGAAIGAGFGGIGAIPGAIIGGFLGGSGGRAVENKYRDNQNFFGAGGSAKSAFGEGALSGALSGAGEAFQLAKAGKAVTDTRGIANIGKNIIAGGEQRVANIAEKQALKDIGQGAAKGGGRLSNVGDAFRAQPRGIVAGIDQGGGRILTEAQAKAENQAINEATKGLRGLTKTGQFILIDKRIGTLSKTYKLTPEAKAVLGEYDVLKLIQGVESNITANTSLRGNLTKSAETTLNNIYNDLSNMATKTRGDLVDYAAQVNSKAAGIINKGQVGSKEVQIWEEVRNATKDFIDNNPSFADKSGVNKKLTTLLGARSNLSKTITADVSAGVRSGITVGRAASDAAAPVLDLSGRGLQSVGNITGSQFGRNIIRQSPASLSRAIGGGMQPQDQTQMDQSQGQNTYGQTGGQDMTGMGGVSDLGRTQATQSQQAPQTAYSLEQAMRDLQSTNNPKFQQQIMDRYDFVQKAEASQAGGPQKYNSTAAGVIADTTTGLQALQDLKATIASSKINAPIIGQLRGMNPYDTKAQNLQSQIGIVKQIVGKALEGGVLRKEDEIKYAKILPKLGDSQAVAQNKINQLYGLITQRLSLYKQSISGTGGTDLIQQLQQQGGY